MVASMENPSSIESCSQTFLRHFPDPFLDDNDLLVGELLSQQQHQQQEVLGSNTALAAEAHDPHTILGRTGTARSILLKGLEIEG